ncbi:MAG TPA: radical SAM protein, partial [Chitinophagaceae bacterium]
CVMCDIWKDNRNLKQLTEDDISSLLVALKRFGTKEVVMSGGEALLNPNFFLFCDMLASRGIRITLLSTGLSLKKNAEKIVEKVSNVIVSLDGDEPTHNRIRNIPNAYGKLREGVEALRILNSNFRITARTVIHRLNYMVWGGIIESAKELGLDQISFLPADVTSQAFNRETPWDSTRQSDIVPSLRELAAFQSATANIIARYGREIAAGFIAESPGKLNAIFLYYAAFYELNPFPYKKCNAPWVSTVIEADGTVRPCFFHAPIGNIRNNDLGSVLNSAEAIAFRKQLDVDANETCVRCVCHLHLSPRTNI